MATLVQKQQRAHDDTPHALKVAFRFDDPYPRMFVWLSDGSGVICPLARFPRLASASRKELESWRLIGLGVGIHWEDLDEDISVPNLVKEAMLPRPTMSQRPSRAHETVLERIERLFLRLRQLLNLPD